MFPNVGGLSNGEVDSNPSEDESPNATGRHKRLVLVDGSHGRFRRNTRFDMLSCHTGRAMAHEKDEYGDMKPVEWPLIW